MTIKLVKSPQELRRLADALHKHYDNASGQDGEPVGGLRDGVPVTTVPRGASKSAKRLAKAKQNPVAGREVKLPERRAQTERSIKPLPVEEIQRLASQMGIPKSTITQAARRILAGEDAGVPDTPEGHTTLLLASHVALRCTSPGAKRRDIVPLLSPQGKFTSNFHDVAQDLDGYPDDEEGLEQLANAVIEFKGSEGGDEPLSKHKADAERLRQKLRRGGDDAVLDQLAEWLNIRSLDAESESERAEHHERVLNNLAHFSNSSAGQRTLRGLNTDRVAQKAEDPVKFRQSYTEFADQSSKPDAGQTAVQALLLLLKSYSAEQLPPVIGAMLAATSDDMNADNPSNEASRLHASVQKIGDGFVGNTVVPRFKLGAKRVNDFSQKHGGAAGAAAA